MTDGSDSLPSAEEFEALFVNNQPLSQIEGHLSRFNPIRVMRMERMEIRHSAILAWLLDPSESHGLDDKFLKAFLGEALRGQSHLGEPTALDIARADLRDTIVRREWQNIDIFIHSARNGWGFVVENKYDSTQHEEQLSKYLERIRVGLGAQVEGLLVRGIFLTLHNEEPADNRYVPINYQTICQFLPRFVRQESHLLTSEVRTFLLHYIEILEEEVGMSAEREKMEKLAKQLYREHRKVLAFIMEHGSASVLSVAVENLFGSDLDYLSKVEVDGHVYRFNRSSGQFISLLPEAWYLALGEDEYDWRGCENWWAGYPVVVWCQLWANADGKTGNLGLYAEVGPLTEYAFRRDLIAAIQDAGKEHVKSRIRFSKAASEEGKRFSRFLKENVTKIEDVQDAEEVAEAIRKLLKKFQPEFEAVGAVLADFKHYGYADK